MQKQASKIVVIMGPTASGKSGVAIKLAQKFGGEIISADSRQIFKNMNIGTGKIIGSWNMEHGAFLSENIPHHLIDVAEPGEDFNVSHFKALAEQKIEEIMSRGKLPIICGGTAFWIDVVTKDVAIPEVAPNEELRSMLRSKTNEELFKILKAKDPQRAKTIDAKNQVRLVRAIEICEAIGKVPVLSNVKGQRSKVKYKFLQIGIKTEREKLNEKIKKRLDERFNGGMIKEVENLHKNGITWEWMERIGLEYRWISRFLQGKVDEKEMKEKLYFDIIHYAKRQMTWLKKNENIVWLEDYQNVEKEVAKFMKI